MALATLDALPKELIAHIACCSDTQSVLQLSRTCKTIRAACYDGLVFKHILLDRQHRFWNPKTLDIEAVANRAGNDPSTWARYALADEVAMEHAGKDCPLAVPQKIVNCIPELSVVKHPLMYDECWKHFAWHHLDQKPNQIFCLALAILASEHDMPQIFKNLNMQAEPYLARDDSMKGFLWALCTMALTLRSTLRTRLAAWPYNNNAHVPHIVFPKAPRIPLRPLDDSYSLPLPFSRRAVELLGRSTTSFSSWDSWYDQHNTAFANDLSNITEGVWCGYYVHFGVQAAWLDPPMTEIQIQITDRPADPVDGTIATIEALNCRDGIDTFVINGTLSRREREIVFLGEKRYYNGQARWDWDLRLTPFGLVGYWGATPAENTRMQRYGIVWLWKKEWTDAAT